MFPYQILAFTTHRNIQKWKKIPYKNNNFRMSTPTWNDKFELFDGSNSVCDVSRFVWAHH